VINGTVIGCIIGVLLIVIYRVALATRPASD
jgi:hypothetical protein